MKQYNKNNSKLKNKLIIQQPEVEMSVAQKNMKKNSYKL